MRGPYYLVAIRPSSVKAPEISISAEPRLCDGSNGSFSFNEVLCLCLCQVDFHLDSLTSTGADFLPPLINAHWEGGGGRGSPLSLLFPGLKRVGLIQLCSCQIVCQLRLRCKVCLQMVHLYTCEKAIRGSPAVSEVTTAAEAKTTAHVVRYETLHD